MAGVYRHILGSGAWYSKGKSHHADKYVNDGQGIVGVGGLVSPAGFLYVEVQGEDGIGMCNFEVLFQKGRICWTFTMGHNELIFNVICVTFVTLREDIQIG